MKREIALRMLADIFIPVGERDGFITSMYEMVDDANATLERMTSIENELQAIRQSLTLLHEVLADKMVRTEESTLTDEELTDVLENETLAKNDTVGE